jgi:hypothetical protein
VASVWSGSGSLSTIHMTGCGYRRGCGDATLEKSCSSWSGRPKAALTPLPDDLEGEGVDTAPAPVRVRNQSPTPCRHSSRCGSTPRASASASGRSLLWQPCCAYDGGHAARSRRVASQPRGAMRRRPWRLRSAIALLRPTIRRTAQPPASTSARSLIAYNPCLTGCETSFTLLSRE